MFRDEVQVSMVEKTQAAWEGASKITACGDREALQGPGWWNERP